MAVGSDTITAANAEFWLTAKGLFPAPQRMEGFMSDRMWTTDAVDTGEFVMGVDGNLSAGWVAVPKRQTLSIMPDSKSNEFFEVLYSTEELRRAKIRLDGVIILPGVSKKYTMVKGFLANYVPIINAGRVLEGRPFQIVWQAVGIGKK